MSESYRFKLGMCLNELAMPLDEAVVVASEIGAEYVWFDRLTDRPPLAELPQSELVQMAETVAEHDLKLFIISAAHPFKTVHLMDVDPDDPMTTDGYRREFDDLVRSMEIANLVGVDTVLSYGFAWPGEYSAAKPTWPMRWLTSGGVISDGDMDRLVAAFTPVLDEAERHDVNVALAQMPWNYSNTTGNFRRLAERLGSPRLKVMWGPADNYNCGESDAAEAGFNNIRPYLHSLHMKNLQVNDGLKLDFDYVAFGEGHADYKTAFRNMRDADSDAVLAMATHYVPDGGTKVDAMKTNYDHMRAIIAEIEAESGG